MTEDVILDSADVMCTPGREPYPTVLRLANLGEGLHMVQLDRPLETRRWLKLTLNVIGPLSDPSSTLGRGREYRFPCQIRTYERFVGFAMNV